MAFMLQQSNDLESEEWVAPAPPVNGARQILRARSAQLLRQEASNLRVLDGREDSNVELSGVVLLDQHLV
jgi:hypothetical protein